MSFYAIKSSSCPQDRPALLQEWVKSAGAFLVVFDVTDAATFAYAVEEVEMLVAVGESPRSHALGWLDDHVVNVRYEVVN